MLNAKWILVIPLFMAPAVLAEKIISCWLGCTSPEQAALNAGNYNDVVNVVDMNARRVVTYQIATRVNSSNERIRSATQVTTPAAVQQRLDSYLAVKDSLLRSQPIAVPNTIINSPWDLAGYSAYQSRLIDFIISENYKYAQDIVAERLAYFSLYGEIEDSVILVRVADGGTVALKNIGNAMDSNREIIPLLEVDFSKTRDGAGNVVAMDGGIAVFNQQNPLHVIAAKSFRNAVFSMTSEEASCQYQESTLQCNIPQQSTPKSISGR